MAYLHYMDIIDTACTAVGMPEMVEHLSVCVCPISSMWQVCCWVPCGQEILIDNRHSAQQQMQAVSYWQQRNEAQHTHTHTRLTALFPGLSGWAGTRKVKPVWILLKQETVSGSGISWAICKSASRSRQITMPVPHHSVFYRPDALPAAQPTASKHSKIL